MNTLIYYFTGTGSSLHAARELQRRIAHTTLVPAVSQLVFGPSKVTSEAVGFVFPTYFLSAPAPISRLVQRLDLSPARYIFAVATRGGTKCLAPYHLDRALRAKGKRLDADWVIDYPFNSPTGLKPGPGMRNWTHQFDPYRMADLEAAAQLQYDEITLAVAGRRQHTSADRKSLANRVLDIAMQPLLRSTANTNIEIPYAVDYEHCTGCGACERVCPASRIMLIQGRPEWRKCTKCFYCYACFNFCGAQAIIVKGRYERRDGRYRFPGIFERDIADQRIENIEKS